MHKEIILILHDIRSTYNVGSIFRTADARGVSKIYLTGITPTPIDRFGRKRLDIKKTALGAEESVLWEKKTQIKLLISDLKKEGFFITSVEQDVSAIDYKKMRSRTKTVFIFGNEVKGLSKEILDLSDSIVEIPMRGKKESLNVSVALGIILFR